MVSWLGSDSVLFSLMIWGVLGLLSRGVGTLGGFLRVGVLLFSLMIWCVSSSMMGIVSSSSFIGKIVCLSLMCVLFMFFNVSIGFIRLSFCVSLMRCIMGIIFIVTGVGIGVIYLEGRGSLGNGPKMPPHGALIYRGMKHLKRYTQLFESVQELSQEQRDWLDKCTNRSWKVNSETGLVDVGGDFKCDRQGLDSFKGVRFGTVDGSFYCFRNSLTSLEGAPQSVDGSFYCHSNSLTSLKGAPQSVSGHFDCSDNSLTSLEGAPRSVGGHFDCPDNSLTSLEGAPQSVDGTFSCYNNSLTSLEGAPQSVGGNFYCHNNTISERTIKGVLKRMSDSGISLEQAVKGYWRYIPKDDRLYLAKHHPNLSPVDRMGYEALLKFKGKVI